MAFGLIVAKRGPGVNRVGERSREPVWAGVILSRYLEPGVVREEKHGFLQ